MTNIDIRHPIIKYIYTGNRRQLILCLKKDPFIIRKKVYFSHMTKVPMSLLHFAVTTAFFGDHNTDIAEELINHGADIDDASCGETALRMATWNGTKNMVQFLLSKGARDDIPIRDGYSPLLQSATRGQTDMCQLLIEYGSNINQQHPLTQDSALSYTASAGHHATLLSLLSLGACVDNRANTGFTPLAVACQNGHLANVVSLLQAGARMDMLDLKGAPPIHKAAQKTFKAVVVLTLLEHGCDIEQADYIGYTPLISAALSGSDKVVRLLLQHGADPNATTIEGQTALTAAIHAGMNTTIAILAPVVTVKKCETLHYLAKYNHQIELNKELILYINSCKNDIDTLDEGMHGACLYGAVDLFNLLTQGFSRRKLQTLFNIRFRSTPLVFDPNYSFIKYAVMSDCPDTCAAVLEFTEVVPEDVIEDAKHRGNTKVIELLIVEDHRSKEEDKEHLKMSVINKTADILDLIPRFVEFNYEDRKDYIRPLLSQTTVPYSTLLEKLQAPKVHTADKKCPKECPLKPECNSVREAITLVKDIVRKLGAVNTCFEGVTVKLVGSLNENTRVFFNDELDMHISLGNKWRDLLSFDSKNQLVKSRSTYYTKKNKQLDTEKFFFDFLGHIYKIVSEIKVRPGSRMSQPTTNYTPCLRCMSTEWKQLQTFRCRHRKRCKLHNDACNCRHFTIPSLTHSKSGVVLHLEWEMEGRKKGRKEGRKIVMDIDLVPILPSTTPCSGDITPILNHLAEERPVGWLEEIGKLHVENMPDAAYGPHLIGENNWHINMRLINRQTVLPRQSIPFFNIETLKARKRDVYLIMKMLKYFTDSSIKSYQAKFAVEQALRYVSPGKFDKDLGVALRRVIDHWTIRDKFSSVHQDLIEEGIVKVEIGDTGINFIREGDLDSSPKLTDKEKAHEEKLKGNEAYQKRQFGVTISHYEMALELDMEEIVYWNNLAAVMFETEAFKECMWMCNIAVKFGKKNRAVRKHIDKALSRYQRAKSKLERRECKQR